MKSPPDPDGPAAATTTACPPAPSAAGAAPGSAATAGVAIGDAVGLDTAALAAADFVAAVADPDGVTESVTDGTGVDDAGDGAGVVVDVGDGKTAPGGLVFTVDDWTGTAASMVCWARFRLLGNAVGRHAGSSGVTARHNGTEYNCSRLAKFDPYAFANPEKSTLTPTDDAAGSAGVTRTPTIADSTYCLRAAAGSSTSTRAVPAAGFPVASVNEPTDTTEVATGTTPSAGTATSASAGFGNTTVAGSVTTFGGGSASESTG